MWMIRLGGYARERLPVASESFRQKLLILGFVIVGHLAFIGLWMIIPAGPEEVREVVRYFDVSPSGSAFKDGASAAEFLSATTDTLTTPTAATAAPATP